MSESQPLMLPSSDNHRARRYWRAALIGLLVAVLDLLLLRYFNTLLWPYLWPAPLLYIIIGVIVGGIWFREYLSGVWAIRLIGGALVFIGECYLLHSIQIVVNHPSLVAIIHLFGFCGTFCVVVLSYINQFNPKIRHEPPPLMDELPHVAAVIPTYGEPYEILHQTIIALQQLDYPAELLTIIISDDGHRDEIAALAERCGIGYNRGARKDAKAGNLNSALDHLRQHYPQVSLILTQDADELIDPSFLRKTVGYFSDPQLAFVQTPKEAFVPHGDPFGNRDRIFYDTFQPGRNGSGAAFSCGSGVIWRIAALHQIGGFVTWNIVEDLTTSYRLHSAGFRSEYHRETLSIGLSPDDMPGLIKQRGTWATDTWRLFLFDNPLVRPGLTLRQRMQYLELGLFYTASVLFLPVLMLTPAISLATGQFIPIEGAALFPWVLVSALYYAALARGSVEFLVRMWQYWVGHWPTYTKAFFIAIRSRANKPSYKVTRKTRLDGFHGHMIWPQFLYVVVGLLLMIRGLFWMPDVALAARLTNVGLLGLFVFLVSGICRAAFYGVTARMFLETIAGYFTTPIAALGQWVKWQPAQAQPPARTSQPLAEPLALPTRLSIEIGQQRDVLVEREVGG